MEGVGSLSNVDFRTLYYEYSQEGAKVDIRQSRLPKAILDTPREEIAVLNQLEELFT